MGGRTGQKRRGLRVALSGLFFAPTPRHRVPRFVQWGLTLYETQLRSSRNRGTLREADPLLQ